MSSMETETTPLKWEGKHRAQVNGVTAEQVWPHVSDFCNLHKWIPTIDTCHRLEGSEGQPGLIRYCVSTKFNKSDGSNPPEETTSWAKERLVKIDPIGRSLSYEILENNVGFRSYEATVKVIAMDGGDDAVGCEIEWSYVADPVEGWRMEDLDSYVSYCLKYMAEKMENCCLNNEI